MSNTSGIEKALSLLKNLPRVSLANLAALPGTRKTHKSRLGQHGGRKCGRGNKGSGQRNTLPPLGYDGFGTPFHLRIPMEPYYMGHHMRRQYVPLSLLSLQRLVDLGRLDTTEPVDLSAVCNSKVIIVDPVKRHYGINLIDEGADIFRARLHIEVQRTNEATIAAVERAGGTITTRFYDLSCVEAMANPEVHFHNGRPIPRCKLPPQDSIEYYSDPRQRGYLADPVRVAEARLELAQKYGYKLPELDEKDPMFEMMTRRKDPRQIWFGLEPGWVVNLTDRCILKPADEKLKEYYRS